MTPLCPFPTCVGLGKADGTLAGTIRCPVATQIIESIASVLCGGIHLSLNTVYKTGTEQVGRTGTCPNTAVVIGGMLAAQHELADHGVRGILHPRAGTESSVAVGTGSIGGFQPGGIG